MKNIGISILYQVKQKEKILGISINKKENYHYHFLTELYWGWLRFLYPTRKMERGWRVPLSSRVVAELLLSLEFSSSLGLSKPALTKLTWSCSSRVDDEDEEDEKQRLENQLSLLLVAHQHCPPVAGSFPASKITKLEEVPSFHLPS